VNNCSNGNNGKVFRIVTDEKWIDYNPKPKKKEKNHGVSRAMHQQWQSRIFITPWPNTHALYLVGPEGYRVLQAAST